MRNIILTTLAYVALATSAQAQSADGLAEAMRQSIARCGDYASEPGYALNRVSINDQCAKVQFQALQSYVDAANKCINEKTATLEVGKVSESCKEAQIIEKSLIKTFQVLSKTAKK